MGAQTVQVDVFADADLPDDILRPWDELAVAVGDPRSAPAPVLAWCRNALPPRARVRVVVASGAGGGVVGVLPLVVFRDRLGLVHCDVPGRGVLFGVDALVDPGCDVAVLEALAREVPRLAPVPDTVTIGAGRPASRLADAVGAALADGFEWSRAGSHSLSWIDVDPSGVDGWLGRRSSKFAREYRRKARRIAEEGFIYSESTDAAEIAARLAPLRELTRARQRVRGGGGYRLDPRMFATITDIARAYSGTGRLRLGTVECGDTVIAAHLLLAAGDTVSGWLTGYDERWGKWSPGILALGCQIDSAASRGERRVDLGAGDEPYKRSVADHSVQSGWQRWQRLGRRPLHSPVRLFAPSTRRKVRDALDALGASVRADHADSAPAGHLDVTRPPGR